MINTSKWSGFAPHFNPSTKPEKLNSFRHDKLMRGVLLFYCCIYLL